MVSRRNKKKKASANAGCLILLVGFIVLFAVFAIKLPEIKTALKETKFIDLVRQRVTTTTAAPVPSTRQLLPQGQPQPEPMVPLSPSALPKPIPAEPAAPFSSSSTAPETNTPTSTAPIAPVPTLKPATPTPSSPAVTRMATLYFVKIEEDGAISRHEVKRPVSASDAPLADALNALFAGPSEAEIRSGLVSLIPRGTKLLGAAVRGSTAIINVSDAFMYNRYAVEGFSAQLRQIVYTATAFPSIQDVQFLIEGKQKDYLGGEGVYIGKPLSRNSF